MTEGGYAFSRNCRIYIPFCSISWRELLLLLPLIVAGCAGISTQVLGDQVWNPAQEFPKTLGEAANGYGYIPLDGLAVVEDLSNQSCVVWAAKSTESRYDVSPFGRSYSFSGELAGQDPYRPLLESLPDVTVRFAVGSFDGSGSLTFGPAKVTVKDTNYRAVLDYVNVDVIPVTMLITPLYEGKSGPSLSEALAVLSNPNDPRRRGISFSTRTYDKTKDEQNVGRSDFEKKGEFITFPVYAGIGMRLTADVRALEANVALTSLGALGAEASNRRLSGTLTVQTIGITGEGINTALPLPSTLDQTTIENGILAIGGIRAVVYKSKTDGTVTQTPRVVGLYSPVGSAPLLINAVYSELSRNPPRWPRPCVKVPQQAVH